MKKPRYGYFVNYHRWLRDLPDDIMFFGLLWVFALSLVCFWLGIPVIKLIQKIASALTGGV